MTVADPATASMLDGSATAVAAVTAVTTAVEVAT